jgi:hypothetical protein
VPLGSFPRDEHPVAATASAEKYTTKKEKKREKWSEKICHSSSLEYSERRALRTVACFWNSLPAYFNTAMRRTAEVLGTEGCKNENNRQKGGNRAVFLEK